MVATGNRTRLTIWLLAAAVIGAGVLYFVPPACFPPCPLHVLTGWNCPGCGATRAAHELLHGHIRAALQLNAPLVLAGPVVLAIGFWQLLSGPGRDHRAAPTAHCQWLWLVLLLVLTFGIVRNIPSYPFTILAP